MRMNKIKANCVYHNITTLLVCFCTVVRDAVSYSALELLGLLLPHCVSLVRLRSACV